VGQFSRWWRQPPRAIALSDPQRSLTWDELEDEIARVANGFRALDLRDEGRIAVFAENSVGTVLVHLGALVAGASTVPVNFHLGVAEVAYILTDAGARVVVVDAATAVRGCEAARLAGVDFVVGWGCAATGVVAWDEWLSRQSGQAPLDARPRPTMLYTSGTTGVPKGVELPPSMLAGGATIIEHLDAVATSPMARLGTHLVVGPLYHTGPLSGARLLAAGTPVVVLGRFDAEATLQSIDAYDVATTVMVPTHFIRLLELDDDVRSRYDLSSLRFVAHTGASCPVDVKRRMIEWWGPVLFDAYGATEVGITCMISSEEWLAHPGSVGRCVPPFEAHVVDDNGDAVPAGTEGRLYFVDATGRGILYHNDEAKSREAHLRPGVFTLGEIGYVDDDGYVYITDRFSDMVVCGGVNIYPAEAEAVLLDHPAVTDVTCIGVPHPEMGEQLKALVVPSRRANQPTEDELIAWCRQHIAHYKSPRSVAFVESIPRSDMGKANKRALRLQHDPARSGCA
jgi:long-chain acyl-CoA synthetase